MEANEKREKNKDFHFTMLFSPEVAVYLHFDDLNCEVGGCESK
jgi:hypothetical protein